MALLTSGSSIFETMSKVFSGMFLNGLVTQCYQNSLGDFTHQGGQGGVERQRDGGFHALRIGRRRARRARAKRPAGGSDGARGPWLRRTGRAPVARRAPAGGWSRSPRDASNGFFRIASQPARRASSSSNGSSRPAVRITRTCRCSLLMARHSSKPLRPGRKTSAITRSGSTSAMRSMRAFRRR